MNPEEILKFWFDELPKQYWVADEVLDATTSHGLDATEPGADATLRYDVTQTDIPGTTTGSSASTGTAATSRRRTATGRRRA